MAQHECDNKTAVGWLAAEFGKGAVLSDEVAKQRAKIEAAAQNAPALDPLRAHTPEPSAGGQVRGYLVGVRQLSGNLIDALHERGLVYADKFRNACFTLGSGKGLALRGTGAEPFHGVRGQKLPWILPPAVENVGKVAFVESPIDALSLRQMGFKGQIHATLGNAAQLDKLADRYRSAGLTVVGAFDNDKAGAAMCRALGAHERITPNGKDWNDDLRAGVTLQPTPAKRRDLEMER
jgi:hypothetical protein